MPTPLTKMHQQLAGSELKPVYLIAGEEHLLALEAADAVRARARALGFAEREVLDAEAQFDWGALARAGATPSLFAARRLIELRLPTGRPGKEGGEALVAYCAAPPPDTVLLITASQWSREQEKTAWVASVERVGLYAPAWPLKPEEFVAWIGQRMAARGLRADRDAIAALAARVEGNSLAAAQEIDKLVLLCGGQPLDAQTLERLVADSARFDAFQLGDAALAGHAARALRILDGLRAEGEPVPVLLGAILYPLQLLARLAATTQPTALFRAERIWPAREALYRKALLRGEGAHWQRCLLHAGWIDRIAKGRAIGDAWQELERLVLAIAEPSVATRGALLRVTE
jgi:DNA polymerase-3 subunit delta